MNITVVAVISCTPLQVQTEADPLIVDPPRVHVGRQNNPEHRIALGIADLTEIECCAVTSERVSPALLYAYC